MTSELRAEESTRDARPLPPTVDANRSVESEPHDAELAPDDFGAGSPKLHMRFLALDGQCIPKLGVLVHWPGGSCLCKTDADGCLPAIEAPAGAGLKIAVQRFDGSYKDIGGSAMPATDGVLTLVSPRMAFEIQTEPHAGAPGDAEKHVPRPDAADHGDLLPAPAGAGENGAHVASGPAAGTPQIMPANAVPLTPAKPPAKSPTKSAAKSKPGAAKPPQHISGKTETKPTIQKGRDANGNPLAVIAEKALDWWNSWRLPTLNLWGRAEAAGTLGQGPTAVIVSADMRAKLDALLAFATEQTLYKYADGEGTAAVVADMARGKFKHAKPEKDAKPEKEADKSISKCYQYVRVALTRAKIVDGILADDQPYEVQESASKAGRALLTKGFADVTDLVPDARWAAAGDIIVYEWTAKTWTKRKDAKKKKGKKSDIPNHGHIDIRSVETYISDYIPGEKQRFHPRWSDYQNIRIYRKFFDPLPTLRIKAFLRCLREFECQQVHDDSQRYRRLNTALPMTSGRTFSNYDSHPWEAIPSALRGDKTAAGAYQIVYSTWKEKFDQGLITVPSGKPRFTPEIQDRIAVMKIEDRLALHLVRAGKVEDAVALQGMRNEWTSLPGGSQNSHRHTSAGGPMNTAHFRSLFDSYLIDEKRKVGMV